MKAFFSGLAGITFINLVPYIMALFMLMTNESSIAFTVFIIIQSLFSIPTSLIGFALQYDLGEIWWVILNSIIFIGSGVVIIKD
jgi:ABC-type tungstate transport system substrate-binding protein